MQDVNTTKLHLIQALCQEAVPETDYLLPTVEGIQLYLHREHDGLYIIDLVTDKRLPWAQLPEDLLDRIIRHLSLRYSINQPHNLNWYV